MNPDSVKHLGMHSNSILVNTNLHYRSRSFVYKKGLSLRSLQYSYLHFMFYSIQLDFKQILIRKVPQTQYTLPGRKTDIFFNNHILKNTDSSQRLFGACLKNIIHSGVDKHSLSCQRIRKLKLSSVQNLGIIYAFLSAWHRRKTQNRCSSILL